MSDFLSNDFRNFSCCSGGSFRNFTEDAVQTSSWIIAGDSNFDTTRIALNDVTRFVVGNIVEVSGGVYSGKFELSNVIPPVGSRLGSIVLKTKFLKTSPTAKRDATYTNGYVDTAEHSVKNITMFSPLVLQYAELIRNTKGKDAGGKDDAVFDDINWYQWVIGTHLWDLAAGADGILQVAYRRLKAGGAKGTYSVAEMKLLRSAATTAIATIKNKTTRKRANDFMNNKFMKLQDSSILMPSTTINEAGKIDPPSPTTNDSPVAQAGRGGNGTGSGAGASVSGASMGKYLFLGVAAIGAFFLIRSIVKKQ